MSAYKDKIGRGSLSVSRQYYWNLYGRDIIKKYRKIKSPPRMERTAIGMNLIPTFPEFVQFVIDRYPKADSHWVPQTRVLDFCKLSYD